MIMCRFLHKFDTSNWYIKADFFQSSPAGRIIDPFNNWIPVHVMILQFPLQCQINSIVAKYTKAWDKRNWKEFKRQIEKDLTFVKFKTRETALRGTLGFSVLRYCGVFRAVFRWFCRFGTVFCFIHSSSFGIHWIFAAVLRYFTISPPVLRFRVPPNAPLRILHVHDVTENISTNSTFARGCVPPPENF